mmetsp:Transcript_24477/g.24060  ORF Transcript_24477/g.24060 Transcript_24477/m.24060 type:complete len:109 (+) Transcript_24477:1192-1518(+)
MPTDPTNLIKQTFSFFQIFKIAVKKHKCCKSFKKEADSSFQNGFYEIGKARLINEFDCIEVLNKLRLVTILYNLQKAKVHKALSDNQDLFMIKEKVCRNTSRKKEKLE